MKQIIGIDPCVLSQVNGRERMLYGLTGVAFLVVSLLSFVTNGYFGWMMTHEWFGALLMSGLMGFIHFSILRIALITMISLPVVAKKEDVNQSKTWQQRAKGLYNMISFSGILRVVFIGLIALTMAFPGVALIHFDESSALNMERRQEVIQATIEKTDDPSTLPPALMMELRSANYPFFVFEKMVHQNSNGFLLFIWAWVVFLPFVILVYLKWGAQFQYASLASRLAIQSIEMDYSRTLEESQSCMDRHFPEFKRKLHELSPYRNPPFNSELKESKARVYGTSEEFNQWVRG